ncbi:hypothetical protein CBP34_13170 [Acidovorax carolinensis]|uniref:MarR family transcriptional regulator n=1 Tax=Acidovorax carolinensis TaxID=553814 RepID=A0A240U3J2_9BURK|nr:hypothetical protein [Acidovorax carolinensis]ART52415.1 hypothetical protein CBP34_13170 [Acidovorax carolinensis]
MPTLATAVQHYLHETLGVFLPKYQPWVRRDELPYFLHDAFDFWEVELLGRTVLVAMDRSRNPSSISDIRLRMDKVSSVAGYPAVYVTNTLASYERKRLIEQKVPFIVPGNQLYLPDLGIDLREYFRQRTNSAQSPISPSAQAMLITALLRPHWNPEWHPSEAAARLGYTSMTLSRAVRELTATGIASVRKVGRAQYLHLEFPPQETWERVRPMLRSPVQRTIWIRHEFGPNLPKRLAGLSALAHHSMLAEPQQPVYAVNRAAWNALNASAQSDGPAPGYLECQLWNYSPALQQDSETVDPLSLMLSLQDSTNERVQGALDELKERLPW